MYSRSSTYDDWRAPSYDPQRRDSLSRRRSRSRDRGKERERPLRSSHRSRSPMATKELILKERMEFYRRDVESIGSRNELIGYLWHSGFETLSDDDKPTLFNEVTSVKDGIVGVDALFQVICGDNLSFESYFCSVCKWWTTASDMFGHLTSYPHRLAHIHRNHIHLHKTVLDEPEIRKRSNIVAYFADQLTKTEGSGQITRRLRCVLSMKAISRLWPDYQFYTDNSWKLTDITNAIMLRSNNAPPSGPMRPAPVDCMNSAGSSRKRRSRSRSRSPRLKRYSNRRSNSRSRSPPNNNKSWEQKAAMFLKGIGATKEAKSLTTSTSHHVNPHKPPGVAAYHAPSAQQLPEMSLDDRLQATFPGMMPEDEAPFGNAMDRSFEMESPPRQEESKETKKPTEDQVGMRKLLGFMVTLQQEVEERGHVDQEAMKKLCREMGIRESNLEKAYSMLNELSSNFSDSSQKTPAENTAINLQSPPKPPVFACDYGGPSTSSPKPKTSLENLGLSSEKLRNLVTQAQKPLAPAVSSLTPPPVPPSMFPAYERGEVVDSGGYKRGQKLPPTDSSSCGFKPSVDLSRFNTSFEVLNTYNPARIGSGNGNSGGQHIPAQSPPATRAASADWSYGWQSGQQMPQAETGGSHQWQVERQLSQEQVTSPPPVPLSTWLQQSEALRKTPTPPAKPPAPVPPPRTAGWPSGWQPHLKPTAPPLRPSYQHQHHFVPMQQQQPAFIPPPVKPSVVSKPQPVPPKAHEPEIIEIDSEDEHEVGAPRATLLTPVPPPSSALLIPMPPSPKAAVFSSNPASSFCESVLPPAPDPIPPPPPPPPPPVESTSEDVGFFDKQTPPLSVQHPETLPLPPPPPAAEKPVKKTPLSASPKPPRMPSPAKPLAQIHHVRPVLLDRPPEMEFDLYDQALQLSAGTTRPPNHQRFGPYRGPPGPAPPRWNSPPRVPGFYNQGPPQQQFFGPPAGRGYNGPQPLYRVEGYGGPPQGPGYGPTPPRYGMPPINRPPYGGGYY